MRGRETRAKDSARRARAARTRFLASGLFALAAAGAPAARAQSVSQEAAGAGQARRAYQLDRVYEQAGELVFGDGATRVRPDPEEVVHPPNGRFVQLSRRTAAGRAMRLLDEAGRLVTSVPLPAGTSAVASNVGFVTVPDTLHGPLRPHQIGFHALDGALVRQVDEPTLVLVHYAVRPDGQVVTASRGPAAGICTVRVYGPGGALLRERGAPCARDPEVAITPDASRLFLVTTDPAAGRSELEVVGAANETLARHPLALVVALAASADSADVALVTWDEVLLIDAASGAIRWRRPARLPIPPDGLFFGPSGRHVVALAAPPDDTGRSRELTLHRFDRIDGRESSRAAGRAPRDANLGVRGVRTDAQGTLRIVLGDRVLRVPASLVGAP